MTVIAAAIDQDGYVWMGSDSISLHRQDNVKRAKEPKVFRQGEMLIGVSGTIRCRQIIQHLLDVPAIPRECNLVEWMTKEFASPLRLAMKAYGGETKNRNGDDEMDARLLIGLRGSILEVDIGYGVYSHAPRFAAIGCADQEANAAMFTALKLNPTMHARAVIQFGLEAAAEFDSNIRPPFDIQCEAEVPLAIAAA